MRKSGKIEETDRIRRAEQGKETGKGLKERRKRQDKKS
jgi:hypothetical protein